MYGNHSIDIDELELEEIWYFIFYESIVLWIKKYFVF